MKNTREILELLSFVWRAKAIVVLGSYPYPDSEKDGYIRRVKNVDALLGETWRIYIDRRSPPSQNGWLEKPASKTMVIHLGKGKKNRWGAFFFMLLCVFRSKTLYIHSIYPLRKLSFVMYIARGKKIVDMHGVVPEEILYRGYSNEVKVYERLEKRTLKKATHLIFVSEEMRQHFIKKYPNFSQYQAILLPILPKMSLKYADKVYHKEKPITVYAGGLQEWQQVPKMLDAIMRTVDITTHKFFCPQPKLVQEMLVERGLSSTASIFIDTKSHGELLEIYQECHYGFILRENNVVNDVACPTKLVEYLATGIVPIVEYEGIGDFRTLGMRFLSLDDFINGDLPSEVKRNAMANQNFAIYNQLREQYSDGKTKLLAALK